MTERPSFSREIELARTEIASEASSTFEHPGGSSLAVRNQGCFITELSLVNPITKAKAKILYSEPELTKSKLSASHVMSPVGLVKEHGLSEGGQHGFARWAKYHEFAQPDGDAGEKRVAFQAKRSDLGIGLSKTFDLHDDVLVTETTLFNSEPKPYNTSLGEHLYFALENEDTDGLKVNGQSIDELLGEGSEFEIMQLGKAIFWPGFNGSATIDFPAGHSVAVEASVSGEDANAPLGMLVWHRGGTPSICFEPTVGFDPSGDNQQLRIGRHETATLRTSVELLHGDDPSKKIALSETDSFEREGFSGHVYVSNEAQVGYTALQVEVNGRHPLKRILDGTIRSYYVAEGEGTFTINGVTYDVSPGDFYTISPGGEYEYEGRMTLFEFNVSPDNSFGDEKLEK